MSVERQPSVPSPASRPSVAALGWLCVLSAAVATFIALLIGPPGPLDDLAATVAGPRTVEGRLTGGFAYAPLWTPRRAADAPAPNWRMLAAAARAKERSDLAPTAASLQALGVAALQAASVEAAVQAFEDAANESPEDAAIQSDLAAAYLARGATPGRAIDLARAFEAADRARRLNPYLATAAFNRALSIERLHLRRQAVRAWDAYLATFGDEAGWADEARRHRAALMVAPPVEPPPPHAPAVERLRAWASVAAQDPEATRLPDLTGGGPFYAAIAREAARRPTSERGWLAEAVRDLLAAEAALALLDYGAADRLASSVLARPLAPESPLTLWATRLRLTTGFNTGRATDQRPVVEALAATSHQLGFTALESDARHRLGALDFVAGRYERAYDHYTVALTLREALGDARAAASSRVAAADALRMLGREPEAWERHLANLKAGRLADAALESARLTGPAASGLSAGQPAVALVFAREAEDVAAESDHRGPLAFARLLQARALWRAGDTKAASATLLRARAALDSLPDASMRDRFLAEFALAESEVLSSAAPAAALPFLAEAERRLATNVGQRQLGRAVLEARVHRTLGNLDAARAALRKGVALVETQEGEIDQSDFLPSFVDASWDVFAELVDLEAEAGDSSAALQWLDRGFDIRRRWSGGPRSSLADVSRGGPLVAYLARDDGLWIWVVQDGLVEQRRVPTPRAALARKAARLAYLLTLDSAASALDEAVAAVAQDVWWPIAPLLERDGRAPRRVALVLDPVLQRVPFALLPWRPDRATRVVEVTATLLCPSLFACGDSDGAAVAVTRVSALHAGEGSDGFAALPAARDEAERIGRRYAGARVGPATETAFAAALGSDDVLHFSGHAVPDERYPRRSELLLASGAGEGVRVPLSRLLERPVRSVLVVLSACRTSRAEARRGEGGIGVAGEFLRAGVRHVVATQWDVRDDAAGAVMDLVHEALAAGAAPWDAVRHAQLVVRRTATYRARDWAGYVAYTAVSDSSPLSRAVAPMPPRLELR